MGENLGTDLPWELWERVIYFLQPIDRLHPDGGDDSLTVLRNLCTINHTMHSVVIRHLYASITICTEIQVQLLHRTLATSPYHVSHIHSLVVDFCGSLISLEHVELQLILQLLYPTLRRLMFVGPTAHPRHVSLRHRIQRKPVEVEALLTHVEPFEHLEEFFGLFECFDTPLDDHMARWTTIRMLAISSEDCGAGFAEAIRGLCSLTHIALWVDWKVDEAHTILRVLLHQEHSSLKNISILTETNADHTNVFGNSIVEEVENAQDGLRVMYVIVHTGYPLRRMSSSEISDAFKNGWLWDFGLCLRKAEDKFKAQVRENWVIWDRKVMNERLRFMGF